MKKIILVVSFIVIVFFLRFSQIAVHAQETMSILVYPAIQDVDVAPGETAHLQVQFRNNSGNLTTGRIKTADYIITDKQGSLSVLGDEQPRPKYAASTWIKTSTDQITIPARDFAPVDLYVTVPESVTSCGYYTLVYFEPNVGVDSFKSNLNSSSSITAKIGALINFNVKQQSCNTALRLGGFNAPQFLEYGPIKTSFDLINSGDIHFKPQGFVQAQDLLGRTIYQQQLKSLRIFPETAKTYQETIGEKWMIGKYQIALKASSGEKGNIVTKTVDVWVFPWKIALVIVLTIILLILLGKNIYKKTLMKEVILEKELNQDKEEIEKLKQQLRRKNE